MNLLHGKPLPIYGDGLNVRDWLYVGDHCSGIEYVLQKGQVGEMYNIGGSSERQNTEVVRELCALLDELKPRMDGRSYCEQMKFVQDRPGHDRRYAMDTHKITSALGWSPQEIFHSGMRKTVQWYIANLQWCMEIRNTRYTGNRLGLITWWVPGCSGRWGGALGSSRLFPACREKSRGHVPCRGTGGVAAGMRVCRFRFDRHRFYPFHEHQLVCDLYCPVHGAAQTRQCKSRGGEMIGVLPVIL